MEDMELYNLLNEINDMNNLVNLQNLHNLQMIDMLANEHIRQWRKYRIRKRLNPMEDYDDSEFKKRFRFSKVEVEQMYNLIDGQNTLEPLIVRQNFTLSGITKLTVALRFYAVGTFYIAIGDMFGISKSLVEVIICEVSFLIATKLRYRYIVLPETPQELLNAKVDFMRWSGFPLCIGAVDGTHVLIQSFGGRYAEIYRNRKMVFSLNCQVAVSADDRVLDIVSRWPGSAHDSTIFTHSNLCRKFRRGDFGNDSVIVVDSAYPPENFTCKPLAQTNSERERKYQRLQIKARNVAERVNGQLKRRFPVLKYGMRFAKKETAQDVVVCCCILHNMRKSFDAPVTEYTQMEYQNQLGIAEDFLRPRNPHRVQTYLIENYFR